MRLGVALLSTLLALCSGCLWRGSDEAGGPKASAAKRAPANGEIVFSRLPASAHPEAPALLYAVSPDGIDPERRLSSRRFDLGGLVTFSPDGRLMAFTRKRTLWVARPDGLEARQVSRTQGLNMLGRWSPDGSRLIYSRRAGVGGSGDTAQMVGADGTGFRELGGSGGRSFTSASWAADGKHVYGIDGGKLGFRPALDRLDLASGKATRLIEAAVGTEWLWVSSSGAVLALRTRTHPLVRELWLLDDGDERLLAETRGELWHVVWSPDGSLIAVSTLFGDDDTARLVILDRVGETVRIDETSGVAGRAPVWAPDSSAVAFARGRFPHDDVWTFDEEGGAAQPLMRTRALERPVAWLPAAT